MDDVKEEDFELLHMLKKSDILLNNIKNASGEKSHMIEQCEMHLKQCKNIISRIEIETRDMDTEDRQLVRQLLKERAAELKRMTDELKWIKSDAKNSNQAAQMQHLDEMAEDEVIEYARNIQEEDLNILDRVIMDVDQTKNTAENVAQKVHNQTEQIQRIGDKLDDIDDELERARRVMKIMLRRVMTDKIVWVMLGLIFIAVCLIILRSLKLI
mmetsp:Transcript_26619/g.43573  ORF Transcript_26619/g.43573 Transcript_26619/m.43573 type:complete len:213 (-) Transcript_26619:286-924(-)|eukprot:CAMPEP_0202708446 /NCGR_PEP_ID=MMETSP1385-20130828/20655_1 /ASSEMBLY_ACC=CAM_ASM_000861 /TAXON_ID=933848 /ORGANISM="Elphidium margaritaceum" /LENGTH=212 /DNA_ID=CAMNT_0049367417 /DNA_START=52 /DNA_END=690 /DNA_ORIENTATION=+